MEPMQQRVVRHEIAEGLLYTHSRLNANTNKRKRVVGQRLVEQFRQNGNGVMLQDPEYDKYTFEQEVEIDCANRVHLCRAACCRLPFALSKQDIREGIVHWDLGQPYLIAHNGSGACCHLNTGTQVCTVWAQRPVPCRAFDCRKDNRIWLDFEGMIINPAIYQDDWPRCLVQEEGQASAS
jgi:Fe-S-cluster containining protein